MKKIYVGQSERCDYKTLTEALNQVNAQNEPATVYIEPGIYAEKLVVSADNVTMIGTGELETTITYGDHATMLDEDGVKYGTFRTATFRVDADNFKAQNITFVNSAGNGRDNGQAVSVYAEGDRVQFENCRMIGCQDTLFTAPLPPKRPETGTNGRGPKADCERKNGRQYYKNCYIEGDIDFIFGGATAYFEKCEIFSKYGIIEDEAKIPQKDESDEICGYITAACTHEGQEYGYVFHNCSFTSDCPDNTVFLGRPWRNHAQTVIIQCELGKHIRREGWYNWGKTEAESTTYYGEYNNTSKGTPADAGERVKWSHIIDDNSIGKYSREKVLGDWKVTE